jgi:hypothetical protein
MATTIEKRPRFSGGLTTMENAGAGAGALLPKDAQTKAHRIFWEAQNQINLLGLETIVGNRGSQIRYALKPGADTLVQFVSAG